MIKNTISKIWGKRLYLWCYVRWYVLKSLPKINLIPAVLALINLISSVIAIGGFDMAYFWGSLSGGHPLLLHNTFLIINILITLLLVYWYYTSERENKIWKTDCQWLFDENDKLRELVKQFMPKSKPTHSELSADMILEQTTLEEVKRGEIHKRLSKKK